VQYNRESKVVRENDRSQSRNTNIKYHSSYTIINTQNKALGGSINEMIRILNAQKIEVTYTKRKIE